jgi:hypothetical protein
MNWKQKIEALMIERNDYVVIEKESLQALIDVAVAAEGVVRWYDGDGDIRDMDAMSFALDKLREVGDE